MKSIRYFVHVAEVSNITTAAKELNMAQPALSRHIRRIEERAGTKLFHRLPRGVRLTPAGRIYLHHCRKILHQIALAAEEVTLAETDPSGPVTIGVPGTLTETFIPGFIEKARDNFPKIRLKIIHGRTPELQKMLLTGEHQVSFLHNPLNSNHLHLTPLVTEALVVYAPLQSSCTRHFFTLRELENTPIIIPPGVREIINHQINPHGRRLNVEYETDSVEAIRRLLIRGSGLTILPVSTFRDDVEAGYISSFPIKDTNIHMMLMLGHLKTELPSSVRAIALLMQTEIADLELQGAFGVRETI